jgi:TonB family protein
MRAIFAAILLVILGSRSAQSSTPTWPNHATATKSPRPDYPYAARKKHIGGAGVFLMQIDPASGDVTSVVVERSTGHKVLDDAVLTAFRQWHWKAGTPSKIRIPVTFVPDRATVDYGPTAP